MMRFLPHRARKHAPTVVANEFGGFEFQNQGFQFYKHPPADAYGLNKLLFESRHSGELRDRILTDFDAVADEYELHGAQRKAAEEFDQGRQGRPGQRARRPAGRSGRASAAGADVAARDLLHQPQARTAGDDGRPFRALMLTTTVDAEDAEVQPGRIRAV